MKEKIWRSVVLVSVLTVGAGHALAQSSPSGLWKTIDDKTKQEKALVRIVDSGGVFTGKIEKLLDPTANPADLCGKCEDDRKDKAIVGMEIIRGVKRSGDDPGMWDGGTILDPKDGKVYRVRLTPQEGGKSMTVRGYIGTPFLGRNQTWTRVE